MHFVGPLGRGKVHPGVVVEVEHVDAEEAGLGRFILDVGHSQVGWGYPDTVRLIS